MADSMMPGRALVIGGDSPIASATAALFEASGAKVALEGGPDADPVAARALVAAACEALGGLDTVIRIAAPALRGQASAWIPSPGRLRRGGSWTARST